jgi:Glucose dehydrogenase
MTTSRSLLACALIVVGAAALLLAAGRPPICTCGRVELWHFAIDSGNSQHLIDWYSPSHLIHGFLFYALGWWLLRSRPAGTRLILATLIESAWEIAETVRS